MQFHHHGYVSGDPRVEPAAGVGLDRLEDVPDTLDVLVVGSGPAGMVTAASLSQFPHVTTRLVERRAGRLEIGQADGIQARSVETFQAFGFAERITAEAYWITQMAFWAPDPADPHRIVRNSVAPDDPTGISEFRHLIVNQARVLDYFAEFARNSPGRLVPDYGYELAGLRVDQDHEHPVAVTLIRTAGPAAGETRTVRAKYVVGGDGARSRVRESIGLTLAGTRANHAWGVMDVLANTDFPDIRTKCAIQSGSGGSILLIPREGGYLFRMYVDLGEVSDDDAGRIRATTVEETIAKANEILRPYTLDVKGVAWSSVYEVGHRLTERFDDVPEGSAGQRTPRVFIAGDACHTHSAKAGQGMNVSMQDAFNLGWKLGYVLSGRSPESLLSTYTAERQVIAQNLIDFDREWSTLMAKRPEEFDDPGDLADFYTRTAEFPAGFMTQYTPSMVTGGADHQSLAAGYPIGRRFKSARVSRLSDGNPLQLGHVARADGRYRIYVFADSAPPSRSPADSAVARWADWFSGAADSPLVRYTSAGGDRDSLFDVRVVYQQPHAEVEFADVPLVFQPEVGPLGLVDREKVYSALPGEDVFSARGIDRAGAVVVVRPDQYVAHVLPLAARAELAAYFDGLLLDAD